MSGSSRPINNAIAAEQEQTEVSLYLKEMIELISTPDEEQNKRNTVVLAKAIHSSLLRRMSQFKEEEKAQSPHLSRFSLRREATNVESRKLHG